MKIVFAVFTVLLFGYIEAQYQPPAVSNKAGRCPPALPRMVCSDTCRSDLGCPGTQKCCRTSCGGSICSRVVTNRFAAPIVKPGNCPAVDDGPWFCSSMCTHDGDCRGTKKCCRNRCGAKACYDTAPSIHN